MCFPPFCQPATNFLGCFGLRQGAAVMMALNGFYGLAVVVLHGMLLGSVQEPPGEPGSTEERLRRLSAPRALQEEGMSGEAAFSAAAPGGNAAAPLTQETGWILQFADLDIGFGHQLFGLDDQTNMLFGLMYGIVVLAASAYGFQAVVNHGPTLPKTARWMVAFLNFEIIIFVAVSLAKIPKMCHMQDLYFPHLEMECHLLKFIYAERLAMMIIIASLCTWIFSSFAFVISFGMGSIDAIDRPEYSSQAENALPDDVMGMGLPGAASGGYQTRGSMGGGSMGRGSMGLGGLRSSFASGDGPSGHPSMAASRHSMVGGSIGIGGGRGPPPSGSYASQTPSYNMGRMPRASSSMQTSTTARSHPETQSLIRPPVAIY